MPRNPRNNIKGSFLHVIVQGINKSYIFDEEEDIKYFIKLMYEKNNENNIKIIAYCVMNNHAHILLETKDIEDLGKYMQVVNLMYAQYYNKKYNRVGYVFRDRYKSQEIVDDAHYYNCIKYIYDNPVKAGMCDRPEDYPYSNFKTTQKGIDFGYQFIDTEEDIERNYKIFIKQSLIENKIEKDKLNENAIILKQIIEVLINKYGLSIRKVSKELNISRERVKKIYNSK